MKRSAMIRKLASVAGMIFSLALLFAAHLSFAQFGCGDGFCNKRPASVPPPAGVMWSSTDKSSGAVITNAGLTLSSVNTGVGEGARTDTAQATIAAGYYAEFTFVSFVFRQSVGVANAAWPFTSRPGNADFDSFGLAESGDTWIAGANIATITGGVAAGDTVDIAFNNTKFWARKNNGLWNTAIGAADPTMGTNGVSLAGLNAGPYFLAGYQLAGGQIDARFSAASWLHTNPSGFGAF